MIDTAASSLHKESIKRGFMETISHIQFRANTHKILEKGEGKGREGKGSPFLGNLLLLANSFANKLSDKSGNEKSRC